MNVQIHPWVWQMLCEYMTYVKEASSEASTLDSIAEGLLEKALLSDERFQKWFTAKITEDIEAWEGEYLPEG